jgi:hypothetical protein
MSACPWTSVKLAKVGGVNYAITVRENVGTGLLVAPKVGTVVNPETIHFT